MSLFQTLAEQSDGAERYMEKFRDDSHATWEEKEALLLGRNMDSLTSSIAKSRVFDPRLSTLVFERAARVMAQHSTGTARPLDEGSNMLQGQIMDLVLQKYVIPGADSQWDLLTKYRMEMIYSNVYGSFGHIVDWRNDKDYVGPDMWLIPARNLLPEPNSISVDDANFVFVDTWITKDWLSGKKDDKGWKNVQAILDEMKDSGSSKPTDRQSLSEETYGDKSYGGKGKYAQLLLRTRYENDRWVTFAPDFIQLKEKCIVRDVPNPHGNNEKPIVMKQTFPLLDRFWGLGDFERGKSLQYSLNSLWNLYMDGVKMSIFPPMIYDPTGAVRSTLKYGPAERWAETKRQSIRRFDVSPQGSQTFQSTFGILNSSLLNQAGTTDTTVTSETDPGMGKSQRYSEPVLTPVGFTSMGELEVGGYVIDEAGIASQIISIHEQGVIDTYDIEFDDGSSTNCSLDHLWTIEDRNTRKKDTLPLKTILDNYKISYLDKRNGFEYTDYRFRVQLTEPVEFVDHSVSVHPYLLGLLLGDGGFTEKANTINFTNSNSDIVNSVRLLLNNSELRSKGKKKNEFRIYGEVVDHITDMGLKGKYSYEKHIPDEYLINSIEVREQILQGLIDTDGYVSSKNTVEYSTSSEQLAKDVVFLAQSLGIYVRKTKRKSFYTKNGVKKQVRDSYRVYLNFNKKYKKIVNITKQAKENSRCIYVDTQNHLYLTKDFTVTHNTPSAIKFLSKREASRDNWESYMMDKTIEKTMNKFVDLLSTKQKGKINMNLFAGEIAKLQKAMPTDSGAEALEIAQFAGGGNLKVGKDDLAKKYKFFIDAGSSKKVDEAVEHEAMMEILTTITKIPGLAQQVAQGEVRIGNKVIDAGEIIKRLIISSRTKDWESIVKEIDPQEIKAKNAIIGRQGEFEDPEIAALAKMISEGAGEKIPGMQPQVDNNKPIPGAGSSSGAPESPASLGLKGTI